MCIFYTFVPFYKFKMQYLYSFTKSFSIIDHAKAPIRVFLCYFSHYMVYQICFRNTYCVTDDIRYQGHKMFPTQELAHKCGKHLVTRPDRSIKVGCNPTICDYRAGLWECAARNNPAGINTRGKVFPTQELAHKWAKELVTRPDRSIKVGCNPTICDYRAGLWECAARNNPAGIKTRGQVLSPTGACS